MSSIEWTWYLAIYLFLGGLAGGAYLTTFVADLVGREKYRLLAKSGSYIAPIPIILGLFLLVLDLGVPSYGSIGLLHLADVFNHLSTSMMSIGSLIILVFSLFAVFTAILWFADAKRRIRLTIEGIGSIFAFGTAIYTGMLLAQAFGSPLWVSPFLPWLFTASALSTGLVIAGLFIPIFGYLFPTFIFPESKEIIGSKEHLTRILSKVETYDVSIIVAEVVVLIAYIASVLPLVTVMLTGFLGSLFWILYVIIGLFIPITLWWLTEKLKKIPETLLMFSVSFVLVLIGGLLLRYIVLIAGQI